MTIGESIRKARKAKGWTQAQLAWEAGTQTIYISFYENDRQYPNLMNLISLADALGVTLDDLVGRKVAADG